MVPVPALEGDKKKEISVADAKTDKEKEEAL